MKRTRILMLVFATAAMSAMTFMTASCSKGGGGEEEKPTKTVSVGSQTGTLKAGETGTVTYEVMTANIAAGEYTAEVANLPAGVTVYGKVAIGADNKGTLTLAGSAATAKGTTSTLALTIDGIKSAAFTLTIDEMAATVRYVTVPFNPSASSPSRSQMIEEDYLLVYSTRDDNYNYYMYYGGRIEFVPVLYQQAVYYNGITPITIGYSKSTSIETTVTQGLEKAVEHSVETTNTFGITMGVSASVGFGGFGAEVSMEIERSVSETVGNSVSMSNTVETSEAKVTGDTFSTEATIGTAGEPVGMYRYALFSTTDVFYDVKFNRQTKKIESVTVSLCARQTTYWGVDYDSQVGGSSTFGKTGSGDKLRIPAFDPEDMPEILIAKSPGVEVKVGNLIWAGANVGETPGTFAADAAAGGKAAFGGMYQFNRRKGWPNAGSVINWGTSIPAGSEDGWASENDPCPWGWRIPTQAECETLSEACTATSNYDLNVAMGKLNDGSGTIYMPTTPFRLESKGELFVVESEGVSRNGRYWTSTVRNGQRAAVLIVQASKDGTGYIGAVSLNSATFNNGVTIRCVRPAE